MNKNKKLWIGIISLALAILIFAIFLIIQSSMQEEPDYQQVLCAKTWIPQHTHITEENAKQYLELKAIPVEWLPEKCLTDWQKVYDKVWKTDMSKGTLLTDAFLEEYQALYRQYQELTWISVPIKELYQGVAGSLRTGDYVDVYFIGQQEENVKCEILTERVRIAQAYSSQGQTITEDKAEGLTQLIVIPMEKAKVAAFYEKLSQGNIRIAKYEE